MKTTSIISVLIMLLFTACKTPQPIPVTLDALTLTVPAGFTEYLKGNEVNVGESINFNQNQYSNIEDKKFSTLQVMSADVSYSEAEDHDYTTSRVLALYRIFHSDLKGDKFTYVDEVPTTIDGKKGISIVFEDKSDTKPLKGEMIAVYHDKKVYVLLFNDNAANFAPTNIDWESIKKSIKLK